MQPKQPLAPQQTHVLGHLLSALLVFSCLSATSGASPITILLLNEQGQPHSGVPHHHHQQHYQNFLEPLTYDLQVTLMGEKKTAMLVAAKWTYLH